MSIAAPSSMAAGNMMAGAPTDKPAFEVTHIEIRRVQNGFIVAGVNMNLMTRYANVDADHPRISYVAKDVAEIASILEWFTTGKDVGWLPTVNLPLFDMMHRPGLRPEEVKEAVKQGLAETMVPQVYREPNMAIGQGLVQMCPPEANPMYGGPLNRGRG